MDEPGIAHSLGIHVRGTLVHNADVILAKDEGSIAWWSFFDMSEYIAKTARVVTAPPVAPDVLARIESSGRERYILPQYREKGRPQFHFSQKRGWNNHPDGMMYYDGEDHLFWQSNPLAWISHHKLLVVRSPPEPQRVAGTSGPLLRNPR